MKLRLYVYVLLWMFLISGALISCAPAAEEPISLASFTENYVDVGIYLKQNPIGDYVLSSTFTPPDDYHLYSKDILINGVDGLGRPTLLELTANSQIKANGDLMESVKAERPDFEPTELLVYPLGEVTLSLRVELPLGNEWMDDEVKVTYMACSASLCKPPVVEKVESIRVPGADMLNPNE